MSNDVWKQPWLRSTTNAYIQTPLYPGMENLKVNDLKDNHLGIWNVPLIDHLFDRGDLQAITNVPILDVSRGAHIWAHISYGVYTVRSAYKLILKNSQIMICYVCMVIVTLFGTWISLQE